HPLLDVFQLIDDAFDRDDGGARERWRIRELGTREHVVERPQVGGRSVDNGKQRIERGSDDCGVFSVHGFPAAGVRMTLLYVFGGGLSVKTLQRGAASLAAALVIAAGMAAYAQSRADAVLRYYPANTTVTVLQGMTLIDGGSGSAVENAVMGIGK